ncbi:hypothetical protein Cgig2_010852 [Carnegiea gigantea]|uniref:Uncharacterized protein n=1 Tax=Carnegiea gigantea TaxID=171969 RepID=A0A9Q1GJS7_9CARY|nr:hypothetical protein Cgig2_010852 [Carnegiea gigantea]
MVDTLKSLMSTMVDAITRQVTEQVKRVVEVTGSARPVHGEETSHRSEGMPSLRHVESSQKGMGTDRKVVATIAGGYATDITWAAWKAQLRSTRQVLTVEQGSCITAPTMMFGGKDAPRFASPYNGPLVVEMKIGSAIVRQILIFTGSSVDIITWDYLKKLAHLGHDIVPMTNPILGFGGQKVRPLGMIRLPVRFGDKARFKSLEDDFLVVNVPTAYNLIIGRLTLHRVRAAVAPYLLQFQFETDDSGVGELHGDQRMARECNTTILYNHIRDKK